MDGWMDILCDSKCPTHLSLSHYIGFTTTCWKGVRKQIYHTSGWRWFGRGRDRLHSCALRTTGWQRPPGKGHRPRWPLTPPMITRHNGLSLPDDARSHFDVSRSPERWTWIRSVTFHRINKLTHCHDISERSSKESRRSRTVTMHPQSLPFLLSHLQHTCAFVIRSRSVLFFFRFWAGLSRLCCSEQQRNGCWKWGRPSVHTASPSHVHVSCDQLIERGL